jgi:cellulose synthase (UDP-forming)
MVAWRTAQPARPPEQPRREGSSDATRTPRYATVQGQATDVVRPVAGTPTEMPNSPPHRNPDGLELLVEIALQQSAARGGRHSNGGSAPEWQADWRPAPQDGGVLLSERIGTIESRNASLPVMTRAQRAAYAGLAMAWLGVSAYFWIWWIGTRGTAANRVLFTLVSVAWFYSVTVLPSFYLFFLGCMRVPVKVSPRDAVEAGVIGRVAVISLTVPGSESLHIVRRQLEAMRSIRYPHDSWILVDKVHSPEIERLARELGVSYFCRHDTAAWGAERVAAWNAPGPPFQVKTKAGNVNAWLDAYGYRHYSHFTQLDIDHRPIPAYLDRVLGYFRDPKVAWVQAPSVYGNHEHWTARGSSEQEVVLQGPLQMGFYGFCRTPFIIGSHCTYDMTAIRRIGGFQPTRAEDHLDTVCLAADGREGVYLPEIIAVGDGPETFDTYLAQQFAWAFSMIQVLLRYTPRLIRKYTARQAVQFLFAQTWYTFWSLSMMILFFAPLAALASNAPISHVSLWMFLLHTIPGGVTATAVWYWSRRWHQPGRVTLSWRGIVLHVARWLVVLSAFVQVLLRVQKPYMITVKGLNGDIRRALRLAVLAPYIALVSVSLGACWLYVALYHRGATQGYLFFGLENAALFWLVIVAILAEDARALRRAHVTLGRYLRLRLGALFTASAVTIAIAATIALTYGRMVQTLSRGRW